MKLLYHSLDLKFDAKDPRNKDAQIIEAKIEHLNKIVEQILDFARTDGAKFRAGEPERSGGRIKFCSCGTSWRIRTSSSFTICRPTCRWSPAMRRNWSRPFLNLILNAAEAMGGGGTLTIRSRVLRGADKSVRGAVEFKDTGGGMSAEQQQRAFKTVLATTKAKGTGLGLAIVGRIVETHHGEIQIRSRAGRGTTIRIALPVK